MKIALDYDDTYTKAPSMWDDVISVFEDYGHEVKIVTARSPTKDRIPEDHFEVLYCDGVAKRFHCHHFAEWEPDIWIDDKPESVDNNSKYTRDDLKVWRSERTA